MATVAFLVHPERTDALALTLDTADWLASIGHQARVLHFSAPDRVTEDEIEVDMDAVDLAGSTVAVSMGGDGTFLRVVRLAWTEDIPVLGVNFGRVGYLPDLLPDQLRVALTRVFDGKAVIEARCALEVEVGDHSVNGAAHNYLALNELVVEKTVFGHTIRLATSIDGEDVLTYSADGVLIATPTGSTAYNLSAGGPILSPNLRAMVMTPVAPHLSLDRSLVLTDEQSVTVRVVDNRAGALVIDGQEVGRLDPGATVTCRVAARPVRVIRNDPQGFGGTLRARLLVDRAR
ncbi:MAG TPA: NAD(+)/NADH kinase [Acidimicrobiales bacterium]